MARFSGSSFINWPLPLPVTHSMPSGAVAMRRGRLPLPVATSVISPLAGSSRPRLSPFIRQNQTFPGVHSEAVGVAGGDVLGDLRRPVRPAIRCADCIVNQIVALTVDDQRMRVAAGVYGTR